MRKQSTNEKHNILLVNSNENDCAVLTDILKDKYCIVRASNSEEALLLLSEQKSLFNAVIFDFDSEQEKPFYFLQRKKGNPNMAEIPVIIVFSARDEDKEEKSIELGADDFVLKPYYKKSLLHRLNNIIIHKTAQRTSKEAVFLQSEREMLSKIIVGGLIGAYIKEGFPLYYISDIMLTYLGFSSKEEFICATGGLISNQIHPDDREMVWKSVNEQIAVKGEYVVEYRYRKKDGTYLWVHDVGRYVIAENGEPATASACYDITEQKKMEQKLQNTTKEMQTIVDNIPGGVVKMRVKGNAILPVYMSDQFCGMMGDTKENLMALYQNDSMAGLHPDDYEHVSKVVSEGVANKESFHATYRISNRYGEYHWVTNRASRVVDKDGQVFYFAVYTNMDKEMQAKQTAEKTNQEMELLYNSIPGAVFKCRFNADWDVIFANDGLFRFLGYTREEFKMLFDNKMSGVIYPEDGKIMTEKISAQLEHGTTVHNENRLICKDGSIKWISIYAELLTDEADEQYFYCTFVDITEQKYLQKKLDNATRETERLYNTIPGAIFKCGHAPNFPLLFANDGMFRFLGYTREEFATLFDNNIIHVIHPDDREEHEKSLFKQLEHGSTISNEVRLVCKGDVVKWIAVFAEHSEDLEGNECFYCAFVDITDQKKAELELARIQEKLVLAIDHAGLGYWDYDIKNKAAYLNTLLTDQYTVSRVLAPYPQAAIDSGAIVPSSYDEYLRLVDAIDRGEPLAIGDVQTIDIHGNYIWKRIHYSTLFDENGKPYWAFATAQTVDDYKMLEQQFSIAAEQTGIDVWIYNIPTKVLSRTATAKKNFGDIKEIENAPTALAESGMIHPDDMSLLLAALTRLEKGESRISLKVRYLDKMSEDYTYHKIDLTLLLDRTGNGRPDRVICTDIDITDKVHLEQQYQEALELYRSSAKDNVLLSGYCSISHNRILGMSAADHVDYIEKFGDDGDAFFIGLSKIACDNEKRQEIVELFLSESLTKAYLKGISEHSVRCKICTENGHLRYVDMAVKVLKNPTTQEFTGLFTMTDVTEEVIYRKVVDATLQRNCDFIVDIDVNNDRYTKLIEVDNPSEVMPQQGKFSEAIEVYSKTLADEESIQIFSKQLSYSYMIEKLEHEDDYLFYYRVNENGVLCTKKIQVFYVDKELKRIGFIRIDVTETLAEEQKKNEALSLALTSAKQANQAKSDFLSRMSHDIRTPMNAIIGMTELAKQDIDNEEKVKADLAVIDNSSKLLLSIINDVLDMSQIESGNMVLAQEPFDGFEEEQNVLQIAKVMFEKKSQKFESMINFRSHYYIGDAVRLKRVVMNLLNNASKYTPAGGSITFTADEETHPNPQLTTLVFTVKDNGIGIPKDKLDSIFTPFEQLDTTVKYEGTGLGLPIVKNIVENQGGTITVESEVGKGSVFTVKIPMRLGNKKENLSPVSDTSSVVSNVAFSELRILLVEDHPVNTIVAKRLLEKCGAVVDTAENGSIGYDKMTQSKAGTYDIIFMDIQMPVMNGYESAKAIRESNHPQAKTIPIIAMTANAFTEDIQKSLDSGMNGHISKPISIEAIANAVGNVMVSTETVQPKNGGKQ